jgi:hypothetical protein
VANVATRTHDAANSFVADDQHVTAGREIARLTRAHHVTVGAAYADGDYFHQHVVV